MKFVSIFTLLVCSSLGDANSGSRILQDAIRAMQIQERRGKPCDVALLERHYAVNWCVQSSPPCSTTCSIKLSNNVIVEACCAAGEWNITRHIRGRIRRRKRGWFDEVVSFVGGVLGAVGDFICIFLCPPENGQKQAWKPPTFDADTCPPQQIRNKNEYTTEKNQKEIVIQWTQPSAKDAQGTSISVVPVGLSSGSSFAEGYHYITYSATDAYGFTAYCYFNIRVKVTRCGNAIWPENGYRSCDSSDPIYGTKCSFYCNDGFELIGNSVTECQSDGTWSGTYNQRCTKKKCSPPPEPDNGQYVCLDIEYSYNSLCWPECDRGYELNRLSYSQCSASKTWITNRDFSCIDNEPPEITSCMALQSFYADSGATKYNAYWQPPEAVDYIDKSSVRVIQDSGPLPGSNLSSGLTLVQYHAVDTMGNKSPKCNIFLEVKIITCLHPSLQFYDENLKFSCKSLNVGESCSVSCRSNLPLLGDSKITCAADNGASTGIWTWMQEPTCLVVKCHDLDAPVNGSLACDSINTRPFCQMFCNANYDIPYASDGRYFCLDSGNWSPNDIVPGCTQKMSPRFMNLGSSFLYFSGSCSDQTVLDSIKQKFLNITTGLQVDYICKGCTIANVKVTCGKVSRRKKKSLRTPGSTRHMLPISLSSSRNKRQTDATHETRIEFNIVIPWNQGNLSLFDAYDYHDNITFTFRDILINMVNAGNFTILGYSGPGYEFQDYGILHCENGFLDGGICRTCSLGMEYNETTQTCQKCPLHTYKEADGLSACEDCPSGHITLETGGKYLHDCIELCPNGTFSEETVVPCTPCPVGSYQRSTGQKTCISCPEGKTTNVSGSTSEAACNYFDIFVNAEISQLVRNISEDMKNLTLALWFQISGKYSGLPYFSLSAYRANDGEYFYAVLQDTVTVLVGQTLHTSTISLQQGKWTSLILSLESTRQRLTMTLGGQTVLQKQLSLGVNETFLKAGSSILMKVGSNTTVSFTELFMINEILSADELASLSSSCDYQIPNSFLSMSDFAGIHGNGIHFVIPSACYAADECSSNPCGNHTCVNSAAGFICRCLRGYSGPTCDTPPDLCRENDCQNGATCINNGLDYNCSCPSGYSGELCDEAPVNGNWSDWTAWTVCSLSCGGGSMSRSRRCDSPSPGPYGLICTGPEQETKICNMEDCPVCPELPFGNGTKTEVKVENGTEIRTIKCQDGLAFAPGFEPNQEYKCGISTNYQWTHTSTLNPLGRPPSCGGVIGPRMLTTSTTITYVTLPCSASSLAEATIAEKLESLRCVSNNTCNMSVSTACSSNRTATATITLTSSLDGAENLDLHALYENNTVSDNLIKLIQAITEIELSTQKLVNEKVADLDVQVYNDTHRVDVRNIGTKAVVDCPAGLVASSGMCVECPLGTYYDSSTSSCHICDLGTYQDESAQSACKSCLAGYTTVGEGSTSNQDCIVSSSTQTTQKTATNASTLTSATYATNSQSSSASSLNTGTTGSTAKINLGASEPTAKDNDTAVSSSTKTTKNTATNASSVPTVMYATNSQSTSRSAVNTEATVFGVDNPTSGSTATNNLGASESRPKDENLPVIIGCSLAVVVLLASGAAGISIYKWKYRTTTRKSVNGSHLSFNQIRPDTPLSIGSSSPLCKDAFKSGHFLPNGQLPPITNTAPTTHYLNVLPPLRQ